MTYQELRTTPCPLCGTVGSLRVEMLLVARELGTWSLAGQSMKTSATAWPSLTCATDGCEYVEYARIDGEKPKGNPR